MSLTAAHMMHTHFLFVDCDDTVAQAEELLACTSQQLLPVLNPDRTVFGVISARELARFHQRPLNNPLAFHAWEICNTHPLTGGRSDMFDDIAESLLAEETRHMLVLDAENRLVGMINSDSLLRIHAGDASTHAGPVEPERPSLTVVSDKPN